MEEPTLEPSGDTVESMDRRKFVTMFASGVGALLGINTLGLLKDDAEPGSYGANVYGGPRSGS